MLWAAFAVLVVASGALLLRACGLLIPGAAAMSMFGWNFCPVTAPSLSAEIVRGEQLSRLAYQLELELAENKLECASLPPSPARPLELPTQRGPVRPQQTAELKSPPALPADRWNKKDLGLLKGCWQLGHETRTNMAKGNGRVELCSVQAGTICFGEDGHGERRQNSSCSSTGAYTCKASIAATFGAGGALRTTQPLVTCTPSNITWNAAPNTLTCRRVNDGLALCRDALNFEHEFRRKDGQ